MKTKTFQLKPFFTSDTHFFHKAMLNWRKEFTNVDDMNDALVERWNAAVKPHDPVIHLGDVSFGNAHQTFDILCRLNGYIHLVRGNHDKHMPAKCQGLFASVQDYLEIDVVESPTAKTRICMSHFPFRTWNRSHFGSWNLHGHSHGNLKPEGKQLDVGVDVHLLAPVHFDYVKDWMANREFIPVDHHTEKG